ncbi:cysteine desulfurase family protein [Bdellovibrio reynosensis]|uniref:cysteine desulfurase n=1 Tax=Bdellovibrio reynosensis TaxID=2835041 RepID=A0ABY4CCL5_9BACT|nr:cysteine desulfurase family protein [Bdellovibrio reynosensis]UOF02690.1 cysteine desulfurase [Bdellovibrio reynosensis]
MHIDKGIYLDYNATTPVDPVVFHAMEPYFKEHFGNPASAAHHWGWIAENATNKARTQVASLIGAKPNEITFTAGATESNNWAIFGLISKLREENPQEPLHFITSTVEHSSIMKAMAAAEKLGVEVDFLPVNSYGQVEIETLKKAIKPHTKLMSFIWVNNEIGTINPIAEIAKIAKENQIYFHTDATQAFGKLPMNVTDLGIDLMSFSAHKVYGPKGIGGLYIRSKDPKVLINPLIYGGGQEKGLRSGTLNVPAIVGMGVAAELCKNTLEHEYERQLQLRNFFWEKLKAAIPGIILNGHPTERAPNNLNVSFPGHKSEQLLPRLQKLGVSTGSACGTGSMSLSHVLLGIGVAPDVVPCTLRLSIGRWTTQEELERAVEILKGSISH